MFSHQPENYSCPFCRFYEGEVSPYNNADDIVYQNEYVVAFISPKWWINNKGHVLVTPRKHYENIYSIPDGALAEVYKAVQKIAVAIRTTYDCEGVSTRQHNEPAGDQDVWHLHVHVYPRYKNDNLYINHAQAAFADAEVRAPYAQRLRDYFEKHSDRQ
jgi:histidine triad (HIT) family protein